MLTYGGIKTWFVNQKEPNYIPLFYGNEGGEKVIFEGDFETSQGASISFNFNLRSSGNGIPFKSITEAVKNTQSKNIIDYLENCVHITTIVNGNDSLSEVLMLVTLGSIKSKPIKPFDSIFRGPSEIVVRNEITIADKLIFTLSLLNEAAHSIIHSEDMLSFAFKTPNDTGDSPFILEYEKNNYYHFVYNGKNNAFELTEPDSTSRLNWIKI
jgi:hypothetical protein